MEKSVLRLPQQDRTAVAVHPDDERYTDLVGKSFQLPLTDRNIHMISDSFVSMEFGTGAVKVTPAHDPNDFEIGERHNLPKITVISLEGTMTSEEQAKDTRGQTDLSAGKG